MNKKTKNLNYESETEILKKAYSKLSAKYNLPDYKKLDEDFDISKADFTEETLLRDIRKIMFGKFSSVLNFVELLLNPSNGSMFHMYMVKGITLEEKNTLNKLFESLGAIEIESFNLDINYSEKNEADFIKESFEIWQSIKPEMEKIINSVKQNWKKVSSKKEKSYFG
ncbi:MAG: hypothetical protein QXI33_03525 [Candidatus Pacearchaeota archaeon]